MSHDAEREGSETSHKQKDLMDLVKGNGPWQWLAFSVILVCNIPDGGYNMSLTFMAPNVDHWCARPPDSNISVKEWKETALPSNDTQCSRYGFNNISASSDLSFDNTSANTGTATCDSWEYDDSTYTSTIVSQWNLVCDREWLISVSNYMFIAGSLLSSTLFAYLTDKFGRKPLVCACNVLAIASGICCIFSNSFPMFAASRLLASAGVTGANQAAATLMVEIVSPKYRPPYTIGRSLAWHVGLLQLPLIAWWLKSWIWMEAVLILPSILLLSCWWLLPESPRWFIARGKTEDALKILSEAAKANGMEISGIKLEEKVAELKESTEDDPARVNVLQLFRPELRLRTLTLWYIWSATSFVYFGISYNTNELSGDPFVNFTAYALIEIPACVLAQSVIQYRGRRAPLAITMACAGATSLLVHLIPEEFGWLRTSVPLFGKFCITATFSILGLFTPEVFPTVLRSIGYGSASAISTFAAILAPFVRELEHAHHPVFPQIIFGMLSITGGGLALLLPETTDRSIPDTVKEASEIPRRRT
ncbi:Solute carrier family 22 member 5 [Araneus ventricosus]|uniref:Solute carrier family 22 member 5 n=1 Tax=Araneus ventricosus TaxID=182803 RepID=A0A4Y2JCH8_ARAVE|nr:Solute carrier family 22 member 5 [Araneus ventricosus]